MRQQVGREEAAEHFDRRRFAGPVGPDESVDLPAMNGEVDRLHRPEIPEAFFQPANLHGVRCRIHAASPFLSDRRRKKTSSSVGRTVRKTVTLTAFSKAARRGAPSAPVRNST